MNDKALLALIISTMHTGLLAQGVTVGIKQSYQPTQQGVPLAPTLFIYKARDRRYGFPQISYTVDGMGLATFTSKQDMITTFQIEASAPQNPSELTSFTASDYLNVAAMVLSTTDAFRIAGVNIMRISAMREMHFKDERGQFEAMPSFDLSITHQRVVTYTTPATNLIVPETEGV